MRVYQADFTTYSEQHDYLAQHLARYRGLLCEHIRRRAGFDEKSTLTKNDREHFTAFLLLEDFCDYLYDAIARDFWDDAFDWMDSQEFHLPFDQAKTILTAALRELEHECEEALPSYSAFLGMLRLNIQRLEHMLYKSGTTHWRELEDLTADPLEGAMNIVLASLDAKEAHTGIHAREVAALAAQVGRKLQLRPETVLELQRGALIHDIGITTTPIAILSAPRSLTPEEIVIMRHHVIAGWEMLQNMPVLKQFSSIVRHHHEEFQGGGYPDGLQGEEIPLLTRIVAIADCFSAMSNERPYRAAIPTKDVIMELKSQRSRKFDPEVTDALLDLVYEGEKKLGRPILQRKTLP